MFIFVQTKLTLLQQTTPKFSYDLKNEDNLKNKKDSESEDNDKNEDDIKNQNYIKMNTSLAAPRALAHRLQRRTACKIQNGRQGAPKWPTGSNPRFLGAGHF